MVLPASALAAYGPERGVYGGKAMSSAEISKNRVHPASATLSKNGKKIKLLRVTAPAACSPSGSAQTSPAWEDVDLKRNGSFSDTDKFNQRASDGSVTSWTSTVRGDLGARGGSGKTRDKATVRDADGNVLRTCDTGVVRFKLKRSERVYGGAIKLGRGFPAFGAVYPVSLERNHGGSELESFRVRYIAKCGTQNHHTNSLVHANIALGRDGDFSASRKFTYRSVSGTTTYKGTFTLRGHLGESRGAGTYRVKFKALLADGTELPCDTGRRKWSVSER